MYSAINIDTKKARVTGSYKYVLCSIHHGVAEKRTPEDERIGGKND